MRRIYVPSGVPSAPEPLTAAIEVFRGRYPSANPPDGDALGRQRSWDDLACDARFSELLEPANQIHRARLLAAKEPFTAAWLNAIPLPSLGLKFDAATVRVAVAMHVGATICEPHACRGCGRKVDSLGHHGLSCRYSTGLLPRHANLNDVVKRGLAAAGVPSWLEPVGLDRVDGRRPDGVTVFPYSRGKCLTWDATCADTYAPSSVVDSAVAPGSAASAAEVRKREHYRNITDRYLLEPVSVETTGILGPSTIDFLRRLGKQVSGATGDKRETSWLMERISLAVVRGNAASILATRCIFA